MLYLKVFVGGRCPETFISWVQSIDNFIMQNQVPSWERLAFAVSLLRGEAKAWWRVEKEARWYEEELIHTWDELKITMSFRYLPDFQWEETEPPYSPPETPLPTVADDKGGETQVFCGHVPDQTKKEEGVFGEASTASELVLALVDQVVQACNKLFSNQEEGCTCSISHKGRIHFL
ncbi:hypothetical protein Bca52824_023067 [Brassica carinata]|uniref:Retrotransposon gag domain-containing protein n=1 Tax=Brassica carinata TaxID=52824 RepID=A0A8X7VHH8_BRACI|nr:hypothetical protein Bca52824_023067 [Brassica carinata]